MSVRRLFASLLYEGQLDDADLLEAGLEHTAVDRHRQSVRSRAVVDHHGRGLVPAFVVGVDLHGSAVRIAGHDAEPVGQLVGVGDALPQIDDR